MDLEEIKSRLKQYKKEQISYNDPHVSIRCIQREFSKEQIAQNLLNPDNLVLAYQQIASEESELKYALYFKLNSSKTLKLIVVLKKEELYIITVIVRWRKWESMIRFK